MATFTATGSNSYRRKACLVNRPIMTNLIARGIICFPAIAFNFSYLLKGRRWWWDGGDCKIIANTTIPIVRPTNISVSVLVETRTTVLSIAYISCYIRTLIIRIIIGPRRTLTVYEFPLHIVIITTAAVYLGITIFRWP